MKSFFHFFDILLFFYLYYFNVFPHRGVHEKDIVDKRAVFDSSAAIDECPLFSSKITRLCVIVLPQTVRHNSYASKMPKTRPRIACGSGITKIHPRPPAV